MMRHLFLIAGLAALTMSHPVAAAEKSVALLTPLQGIVQVDAGDGFGPVFKDTHLKLGDRVMVTNDGKATLSYGGECSFPLHSPSVTTIEKTACATSTQGGRSNGLGSLGMAGSIFGNMGILGFEVTNEGEESPASP